ncbi:MAG: serine/threonine-protein kinase, partial [Planctomycetota bacterium]
MTQDTNRLVAIVDEYLAGQRVGQPISRAELLQRHPDMAPELETCLKSLELVEQGLEGAEDRAGHSDPLNGMLGDFRIIREIGRGGMGVVYEAEQISLSRRVALKVLPLAAVFDERHLQRFRNEAQAAASLHHGNIVPVHAVGQERGVHYYAMQYIEGRTLAQIIEELKAAEDSGLGASETSSAALGALTKERSTRTVAWCRAVARLGIQAAEALDHAHERGVVHRDVKPGNVMVDGLGHAWITDFGLATFERNTSLTMTGDLIGTVRYMSPEQALAKRVPIDHRTDIYSL